MATKILIILALTATAAAASYEADQSFRLGDRAEAIQKQQAPLLAQIQQLQQDVNDATNRLASVLAQNQQWKSNFNATEIQRLVTELAGLQAAQAKMKSDPDKEALDSWLNRVSQLKQYVEQHPDKGIPELKFLTDREWLLIAAPGEPASGWGAVMDDLKSQAQPRFAEPVEEALQKYAQANDGQFPRDLSQLQAYCDPTVEAILEQRYEIKPASILPVSSVKIRNIETDWVIAGKKPIASNTGDHIAIYAGGYAYFW